MASPDRLIDLLVQWENQRRQGQTVTPEQLCPDDATLRELLRQHIQQRERLRGLWTVPGPLQPVVPAATPGEPVLLGFEILGKLGEGGMGVVYKARQPNLERLVALKVIRAGGSATNEGLIRFRQEAEATARLSHPNIVQFYELGEHEGCLYFVLEYVEGGSLAERLRGTSLSPQQAAELMVVLAQAVHHAHQRGILHRDLKPANVLLTPDGTPKIADFGLAKRLDADRGQTRTGAILGTPSYMAPEQASGLGKHLGPGADIYGLGAILYECLTGRPPFKGATLLDTLEQVRSLDPVRPTSLQPKVPRDLETICLKCLQKEPTARYSSAQALASDLECFLEGEPISARTLTPLQQLARTIHHIGTPGPMRAWASTMLLCSPAPFVLHLMLFLLFGDRPIYPVIIMGGGIVAATIITPLIMFAGLEPLSRVPRFYRHYIWSLILVRCAGWLLIPLLVALWRPGNDLSEFFVVVALWAFLDGNFYCVMGSEAGVTYVVGLIHYAVAFLMAFAPLWSPLALGLLMSIQMMVDGLCLRNLQEERSPRGRLPEQGPTSPHRREDELANRLPPEPDEFAVAPSTRPS